MTSRAPDDPSRHRRPVERPSTPRLVSRCLRQLTRVPPRADRPPEGRPRTLRRPLQGVGCPGSPARRLRRRLHGGARSIAVRGAEEAVAPAAGVGRRTADGGGRRRRVAAEADAPRQQRRLLLDGRGVGDADAAAAHDAGGGRPPQVGGGRVAPAGAHAHGRAQPLQAAARARRQARRADRPRRPLARRPRVPRAPRAARRSASRSRATPTATSRRGRRRNSRAPTGKPGRGGLRRPLAREAAALALLSPTAGSAAAGPSPPTRRAAPAPRRSASTGRRGRPRRRRRRRPLLPARASAPSPKPTEAARQSKDTGPTSHLVGDGPTYMCLFDGCGKMYSSTDSARKHCRQRHTAWLRSRDQRLGTRAYCMPIGEHTWTDGERYL